MSDDYGGSWEAEGYDETHGLVVAACTLALVVCGCASVSPVPRAVQEFIARFDQRRAYQDLVSGGPMTAILDALADLRDDWRSAAYRRAWRRDRRRGLRYEPRGSRAGRAATAAGRDRELDAPPRRVGEGGALQEPRPSRFVRVLGPGPYDWERVAS